MEIIIKKCHLISVIDVSIREALDRGVNNKLKRTKQIKEKYKPKDIINFPASKKLVKQRGSGGMKKRIELDRQSKLFKMDAKECL